MIYSRPETLVIVWAPPYFAFNVFSFSFLFFFARKRLVVLEGANSGSRSFGCSCEQEEVQIENWNVGSIWYSY